MDRVADPSREVPDWVMRAQPYDHDLSPKRPLVAYSGRFGGLVALSTHIHQGLEAGIVLSGAMEMQYGESSLALIRGDVWLCGMWEPHAWSVSDPMTTAPMVIFLPQLIEETIGPDLSWPSMFAVAPSLRPRARPAMRQQALSLGQEMFQEIEEQGPDWEVITRLCLAHLLVLLRRQWELSSSSPDPNSARAGSLGRVMPAVALVNANPGRRIAWHQAAAACALSPSRFSFVFHQAMGVSFERFCRRTRLAYVAHLLLTTSVPVTAIADQTDFVDASCPCQPPMEPL